MTYKPDPNRARKEAAYSSTAHPFRSGFGVVTCIPNRDRKEVANGRQRDRKEAA